MLEPVFWLLLVSLHVFLLCDLCLASSHLAASISSLSFYFFSLLGVVFLVTGPGLTDSVVFLPFFAARGLPEPRLWKMGESLALWTSMLLAGILQNKTGWVSLEHKKGMGAQ